MTWRSLGKDAPLSSPGRLGSGQIALSLSLQVYCTRGTSRFLSFVMVDTTASSAESVRASRLREVAVRALDESLAGCSPDDFVEGFPSLSATHREVLQHVYSEAQSVMRENTAVRACPAARRSNWISRRCHYASPTSSDELTQSSRSHLAAARRSLMRSSVRWASARASTASTRCSRGNQSCQTDLDCTRRRLMLHTSLALSA